MCSVLLDVNANTINPINVPIDGSRRKLSNGGHIISGRLERSSPRDFWTGVAGGFVCGMRGRSSTKHPGIIFILLQGGFLARIGGYRWKERDEGSRTLHGVEFGSSEENDGVCLKLVSS